MNFVAGYSLMQMLLITSADLTSSFYFGLRTLPISGDLTHPWSYICRIKMAGSHALYILNSYVFCEQKQAKIDQPLDLREYFIARK